MAFKVFTKIFELDPKKVEQFVIKQFKSKYNFDLNEEEQWDNDFTAEVKWCPTHNQFYVFTKPKLDYKIEKIDYSEIALKQFPEIEECDYHYTFKGRYITLDEYLYHQLDHWHYNFREIYALMTGETEIYGVCKDFCAEDDNEIVLVYYGCYHKNYVSIIKTKSNEWFLQEWKDGETKIGEDGEEYTESIEIRKHLPQDLLDYVIALDPEEVLLR